VHAVSVGEVLAVRPLVSALKERDPVPAALPLHDDARRAAALRRRSVQEADGVFYFPFDFAFIVRRVLEVVRPKLFVMSRGILAHVLRECSRRGVKTAVVNGASRALVPALPAS